MKRLGTMLLLIISMTLLLAVQASAVHNTPAGRSAAHYLFASAPPSIAATQVCGAISADTTWTLANSSYPVTCDVTVPAGSTLSIEAGVVVKFAYYYDDPQRSTMNVRGILNGSPARRHALRKELPHA